MNRLFDEVHSFIRTNELFAKGESILVAFSGGPDSMFLADALRGISRTYRYGWDIRLAHLNHRISERADENEEFCRKAAADYLELPLIINSADIPAMKASGKYGGISIEHLGRRERYRMFVRVCREFDIAKLATGHQLDDQAETVLMRATAGSWLTGLAGIPVRRPLAPNMQTEVVRPLLRIERKQIDEYVKTENVPVFIDPTNQDLGYKRNRVRNDLMPLLRREFNPAAARHLAAIGFQAQELEVDLQRLASGFVSAPTHNAGRTSVRVEIGRLAEQGPLAQRYILRAALLAVGMPPREATHRRVERVRDLIHSERRGVVVKLAEPFSVFLDDADIVINAAGKPDEPGRIATTEFEITRDGTWAAEVSDGPVARITAELLAMPPGGLEELTGSKGKGVEYLDAERVLFPLVVRGRKDGDRLSPLGMDGEKKLQDILVDAKVERSERDVVPLVCDSRGIVWVTGHCIAGRAKVTRRTSQLICLRLIPRSTRPGPSGVLPPIST